ncbi:hypothetical protein [Paraburkholderia sp. XV]|uniref:hypothetical protein n=1 Tax=Paraburkholderia sp. XV TaxID=2831520 RepID=UPI001CD70979|nr:hypothetical protein [Paraburkholderia sp. XV]
MQEVIKCHVRGNEEVWSVLLLDGDRVVASAAGFPDAARARDAAEYLRSGVMADWKLSNLYQPEDIEAAIEPLKASDEELMDDDPTVQDVARVRIGAIFDAAWQSMLRRLYAIRFDGSS